MRLRRQDVTEAADAAWEASEAAETEREWAEHRARFWELCRLEDQLARDEAPLRLLLQEEPTP